MSKRLFKTMAAVLAMAAAATGPARAQSTSQVTDVMNREWTGRSGSSYGDWSGLALTSDAVYAGQTAGGNNAIQMRSSNNNSGIVTTASGGTVASVTVTWNSSTPNGRTLQVYGKHSAYSAASDLYYDNAGDLLGTIVYGTSTPLTIEGDYEYIGLRSQSGALYLDEIQVVWNVAGSSTPEPEPEPAVPHTVRMAEGTEDAANWSLASGNASVPGTQVLENVMSGSQVTATYNGTTKKVKSVKAVKYVPPAATVATAPTATGAIIEVGSTAALVNAGAASGGTMMYAVTTTDAQPASTADFSASVPTAEGRAAGTYYVWYYAKADAEHSDSEIAGPVSVTVTSATTTITWNSSNISDLQVMGTFISYTKEGITLSANANQNYAEWMDFGDESMNGIAFQANESGGYTFTAPTSKQFTKIEMTLNNSGGWDLASLGTGWAFGEDHVNNIYKVTWTGSAASTVGLLTGAGSFGGETVKSIVFTLIDD